MQAQRHADHGVRQPGEGEVVQGGEGECDHATVRAVAAARSLAGRPGCVVVTQLDCPYALRSAPVACCTAVFPLAIMSPMLKKPWITPS